MINFLIKKFIKGYNNVSDITVRRNYGILSGILGIICNIILFIIKIIIGSTIKSIAVISDAFNNLSDTASSLITVIGTKVSAVEADKKHPFGHGRIEYISSLIISFIIMTFGIELIKSSFSKIIHPEKIIMNGSLIVILFFSVLIKIWMVLYNKVIYRKINSEVIKAAMQDSFNDVISTLAIITATVLGYFLPFSIDGYIGLLVALFILFSGFKIARETINLLIGTPPDPTMVKEIKEFVLSQKYILGIHNLVIHDYGPGRSMATLHVEFPSHIDIIKVHDVIDNIEIDIKEKFHINMVIHMDPVITDCKELNDLKMYLHGILLSIDPKLKYHDLRMKDNGKIKDIIFDLYIPGDNKIVKKKKIISEITERLKQKNKDYNIVIRVDDIY